MTPSTRLAVRVALVGGMAGLGLMARVSAQEDQFRRGVEALENKQFQSAASLLREAIKLRPQEATTRVGANPIFRTGGTEYLPHFFLGQALYGAGDCSGAVNEWATSEQQGIVQKTRPEHLKSLRSGYLECEKKGVLPPGKLEPALARSATLIGQANTQAGTLASLGQANLDIWRSDANLNGQFERARTEIENARARYEAARSSRLQAHIDESVAAVGRARTILAAVETSLTAAIDNRRSAQSLIREIGDAIAAADTLNTTIEGKRVPFTTEMTTAHQEGREAVGRARERLAEGSKTLSQPALNAARTFAIDAQNRFKQVLDEVGRIERDSLQRQLAEALGRAQETFSLMDSAVGTLERFRTDRPNVLPPDKVAEHDAALRDVDRLRRRLDAARKSENVAAINAAGQQASDLRDRLNLLIGEFGPLTLRDRGVREPLEAGVRQYLAGEYQQAVASLAGSESLEPDVPLRLHFHLFKAAALYELFLRSRETDQTLRSQAVAEVEHSKAIDSAFRPDARAFSPRFLTFYQSVEAPAAPPSAAVPPPAPVPAPTGANPAGAQ